MLGLITLLGWDKEISLGLELNDDLRGLFQPNLESVTNILHLSGFNWAELLQGGTEHPELMAQE